MLNHVIIMGRLVNDPELKQTTTGLSYMRNTIACDRDGTGRGDREKVTDFIDLVFWKGTAEFVERYFHKGDMILIEGSIRTDKWTDKDGKKRKNLEVNVKSANFCSYRRRDEAPPTNEAFAETKDDGSDCPFTVGSDDDGKLPWEEGELPL